MLLGKDRQHPLHTPCFVGLINFKNFGRWIVDPYLDALRQDMMMWLQLKLCFKKIVKSL